MRLCGAPSNLATPRRSAGELNSITLSWTAAESNGGCILSNYKLFYIKSKTAEPNQEINLSSHVLTHKISSLDNRQYYRFKLVAINVAGNKVESNKVVFKIGTVPSKPSNKPTADYKKVSKAS